MSGPTERVALITGAARRIGAAIARRLHADGYRVLIHHRSSTAEAAGLAAELETARPDSARTLSADLLAEGACAALAEEALAVWGRLDLLVNNASVFEPSPLGATPPERREALLGSNLLAPLALSEALAPALSRMGGAIVNITDVYADRGLAGHTVYAAAKAGLANLTRSLARDLAPAVRVNAVAPGPILWPESSDGGEGAGEDRDGILAGVALGRCGTPEEIAGTVAYLADATWVTGQTIRVDGGWQPLGS